MLCLLSVLYFWLCKDALCDNFIGFVRGLQMKSVPLTWKPLTNHQVMDSTVAGFGSLKVKWSPTRLCVYQSKRNVSV